MAMPEPITLRSPAVCADCGAEIPAGAKARWYKQSQKAYCAGRHTGPGRDMVPQELPEEPAWSDDPDYQEEPPGPREEGDDQYGEHRREVALEQSRAHYQSRMDATVEQLIGTARLFETYLREG